MASSPFDASSRQEKQRSGVFADEFGQRHGKSESRMKNQGA